MSWEDIPASKLMMKRGGSVNPAKFPNEVFDLLSIPAYDQGKIKVLSGAEIGSSKSRVEPGDVLLSKIIPHLRRCWVVPEKGNNRQIGSGEWIIFRGDGFYSPYLKHFLMSDRFHRQFMNTVAGVGGSLVRARPAFVEKITIPLPPLEEQKRIAAILDKADAIRRKRQQAIDLADQFLRSVFLDMFGDPTMNSKGFNIKKLIDVSEKITDGTHQSPEWVGSGVPFLFISNIVNHEIDFNVKKFISHNSFVKLTKNCPIEEGDILYTTVGSYGNAAQVSKKTIFCFQRHIAHIKPKRELIDSTFLWVMMNSPGLKAQADRKARGIAQKTLNLAELKQFQVFVPPIHTQKEFVRVVKTVKNLLSKFKRQQIEINNLFNSLSQRAFNGKLTQSKAA